jgi:NAD(P)-dependent dehydrogenase (short-subunit alcohol dehydrogenase family)
MSDGALAERTALITGASQGLGAEIARHYAKAGASLVLCARNEALLDQVGARLEPMLGPGQRLLTRRADVADPADVDSLVEAAIAAFGRVDILVNNAGVYGPMGLLEEIDWVDWVRAIEINLMGTVYPCRAVLPHMKRQGRGKIVNLSGGGATNPLPRLSAYAASKAAVVRFTETLSLEVAEHGIDVNSVAPGALMTRMMEQLIAAGPGKVGAAFHDRMAKIAEGGGTPLEMGAALCVYLGSAASDGITGRLISAQWDPWQRLHEHKAALAGSDIFTLRRIVPADRGQGWGEV